MEVLMKEWDAKGMEGARLVYEVNCLCTITTFKLQTAAAFSGQLFYIQEWRCLDIPVCLFSDQTRYIC